MLVIDQKAWLADEAAELSGQARSIASSGQQGLQLMPATHAGLVPTNFAAWAMG